MNETARIEAAKQWNTTACEELDGPKTSIDYFLRVEAYRYSHQSWLHDYFRFDEFSGKRVLEIGIGQGTDLMQFARAGAECYGVDITDNHLDLTQRNFELQGRKVTLYKKDATALPFEDGTMDCVYSFGVIHHIPESERVIAEAFRVLRPGGVVLTAFYYKWSAFHLFMKLLCHGVRCGWLLSKGYNGLLATIESGADGVNIKPYVKLYSKREMKKLFRSFSVSDISIHQLVVEHFYPSVLGRLLRPTIPLLENRMGWYVACKAVKPSSTGIFQEPSQPVSNVSI